MQVCGLPTIQASGTQNIDVKMVTISGAITLNGAAMPNDTILDGYPRGSIELRNTDTLSKAYINLGETGSVSYTLKLFSGTYDVLVSSEGSLEQSVLPSSLEGLVTSGLSITVSGTQNIDVRMVTVSGAVTLNGAAMPNDTILDGYPRGSIELRNADTGSEAYINLGETGAVTYTLKLFSGPYDVLVSSEGSLEQSVLPSSLDGIVAKGLSITASGTQSFDVKMVTISGAVTLNGATMPNDTILDGYPRGSIELRNVDTLSEAYINLGETGSVSYTLKLFSGTYDVLVSSEGSLEQSVLPSSLDARVEKGCSP